MNKKIPTSARLPKMAVSALLWPALVVAVATPLGIAAASPLLQWRDPVYIAAGFAGVVAMVLLLCQPLLVGGYLPGLRTLSGRRMHRWIGCVLLLAVLLHVGGLWVTSPPDVVDALLFRSATPFSIWGVIALWAVFAAALLAALRRRMRLKLQVWRFAHSLMALIVVVGSVVHALQIEGTMGLISKSVLCFMTVAAIAWVIVDLRCWSLRGLRKP